MIPITKPFSPPISDYHLLLNGIFERNIFTNNGPLVKELEHQLKAYLNVKNLLYVSNGTIALQLALKTLNIKGNVITTPFSYVATTSSVVWEGCTPVFADIDPETFNIDPRQIEKLVTSETEAILATHCFGNPCDVRTIQGIAEKHGLKLIYDGSHCFGTQYKGESIYGWGDITTASFHATKLFHTIEGGALITNDMGRAQDLAYKRNFGHDGPHKFNGVGINGKNSEFHAAMGLVNLKYVDEILNKYKTLSALYDSLFSGSGLVRPKIDDEATYNHAYYPVLFRSNNEMLKVIEHLEARDIFPRRYFHPSLSSLSYVPKHRTPVSDDIAARILCLPLYFTLTEEEVEVISKAVLDCL